MYSVYCWLWFTGSSPVHPKPYVGVEPWRSHVRPTWVGPCRGLEVKPSGLRCDTKVIRTVVV
eukprot:COSAG05_NODE_11_length_38500_cov_831.349861_40_plen_62_part_00